MHLLYIVSSLVEYVVHIISLNYGINNNKIDTSDDSITCNIEVFVKIHNNIFEGGLRFLIQGSISYRWKKPMCFGWIYLSAEEHEVF